MACPPTPIFLIPLRQAPAPFPPFSPSPSSQRAVVCLAAMEDMETISLSGSARPGRSLGSRHSPAKAFQIYVSWSKHSKPPGKHEELLPCCPASLSALSPCLALSEHLRGSFSSSHLSSPGDDPAQDRHRAARRGCDSAQLCPVSIQCWGTGEAGADPGPGSDLPAGAHPEPSTYRARGQGLTQAPRDPCG